MKRYGIDFEWEFKLENEYRLLDWVLNVYREHQCYLSKTCEKRHWEIIHLFIYWSIYIFVTDPDFQWFNLCQGFPFKALTWVLEKKVLKQGLVFQISVK